MTVVDHWMFRVTRNADLTVEEEEADDLLAALEMELRRRRFGRAVRLEIEAGASDKVLALLVDELDLTEDDISFHRAPLDLTGPVGAARPGPAGAEGRAVAARHPGPAGRGHRGGAEPLRGHPGPGRARPPPVRLVHQPRWRSSSAQAADDPDVLSIKMTLYRTSGDSAIAQDLIRAAERGVQVAVLVELKARFDEQRNITWAKRLRGGRRPRRPRRRRAEDPLQVHARRA